MKKHKEKNVEFNMYVASAIKSARTSAGFTQVGLAKAIKVARQTFLDAESGKTAPKSDMLYDISVATGVPIWFFYPNDSVELVNSVMIPKAHANNIKIALNNLLKVLP